MLITSTTAQSKRPDKMTRLLNDRRAGFVFPLLVLLDVGEHVRWGLSSEENLGEKTKLFGRALLMLAILVVLVLLLILPSVAKSELNKLDLGNPVTFFLGTGLVLALISHHRFWERVGRRDELDSHPWRSMGAVVVLEAVVGAIAAYYDYGQGHGRGLQGLFSGAALTALLDLMAAVIAFVACEVRDNRSYGLTHPTSPSPARCR